MKIIVTGSAGFIGMHLSKALCKIGYDVLGIDNLNDYYSPALKNARNLELQDLANFTFCEGSISDTNFLKNVFVKFKPNAVINLAAQAGVRYSLENPDVYLNSNLVGFFNILTACTEFNVSKLLYASSSSIYGNSTAYPYSEDTLTDSPLSFYAATKKSNELLAHSFCNTKGLRAIGLRFFTVYGSWGRPDMAPWLFTESMIKKKPIKIFNNGNMGRDFTHVSDCISGIIKSLDSFDLIFEKDKFNHGIFHDVYNLGNGKIETLDRFIKILEKTIGIKALKDFYPMQTGDVPKTLADIRKAKKAFGYCPKISLEKGLEEWVLWYKNYHKLI